MCVGRTVPTFRMVLEHVINDWRSFRRALRVHDRDAFDALMTHGREHAAAASNAARLNPSEALFMAILVEHEKALERLERLERACAQKGKSSHDDHDNNHDDVEPGQG